MGATNGTTNGVYHAEDERLDSLYSFWPGTVPAPAPCPEALFSLTLKGKLDGIETLLTVRGQTPEEFQRNLASVRGLLDQPQAPRSGHAKNGQPPSPTGSFCVALGP